MNGYYKEDVKSAYEPIFERNVPVKNYSEYIRPQDDETAIENGKSCADEVKANHVADFEKNEVYAAAKGGECDLMCHVSTFHVIGDKIYMTYYASETCPDENPYNQEARLAIRRVNAPKSEPSEIITIQRAGDELYGRKVTKVYDTVSAYIGGDELFILWTAQVESNYFRLGRVYNLATKKLGEIVVNKLKVKDVVNDFSTTGIVSALAANAIPQKRTFEDIGIMQKFTPHVENGKTYYYTGAYSGFLTFIIKTLDFTTWEYVAAPDFPNYSLWENSTFVWGDRAFYFTRQDECKQGFLTVYDLNTGKWETPVLISDCSSRGDFFCYEGKLYLVNAPKNREGFAVTEINTVDISKSRPIIFADLKTSLFYPFVQIVDGQAYISYTVDRKHIRLSKFDIKKYLSK